VIRFFFRLDAIVSRKADGVHRAVKSRDDFSAELGEGILGTDESHARQNARWQETTIIILL